MFIPFRYRFCFQEQHPIGSFQAYVWLLVATSQDEEATLGSFGSGIHWANYSLNVCTVLRVHLFQAKTCILKARKGKHVPFSPSRLKNCSANALLVALPE